MARILSGGGEKREKRQKGILAWWRFFRRVFLFLSRSLSALQQLSPRVLSARKQKNPLFLLNRRSGLYLRLQRRRFSFLRMQIFI
jgi:hypothetical protein